MLSLRASVTSEAMSITAPKKLPESIEKASVLRNSRLPRWAQRLMGRFATLRALQARICRTGRPSLPPVERLSEFREDPEAILNSLREDGIYLGFNLSPATHKSIWEFADYEKCHGGFGHQQLAQLSFHHSEYKAVEHAHGVKLLIAHYPDPARCPAIRKLANDAKVSEIVARYFGVASAPPVCMMWWSFPNAATTQERLSTSQTVKYHYDEFGIWAVYFNFYLTAVDELSGPHVCIPGTHVKKTMGQKLWKSSRSDREIERTYGSKRSIVITGKGGFGFIEDAACFHKATPPKSKARLFLQIRYPLVS